MKTITLKRVVITGMGAITPIGSNSEETWRNCIEGVSGVAPITQFDTSEFTAKYAAEVKNFDPAAFLPKKEYRKMDRFVQLGLVASMEAVVQSGLHLSKFDPFRVGVIVSSGMGGMMMIEDNVMVIANPEKGPRRVTPFLIPGSIPNMVSGYVSIHYGFKGPNYCLVTACATGAHSIGEAYKMIQYGRADAMVAGGCEAVICKLSVAGFQNMKALSHHWSETPQKASRPFDKDRDGFVMGEGAGVLVLESLESAQARGAKILAEIVGFGTTSDAYHITSPAEDGSNAFDCMSDALRDAELSPKDIAYINMHGTSTPEGDRQESIGVQRLFTDHKTHLNVSSTKSMMGHLLGGAGGVEALICCKAVENDIIPPTINLDAPEEGLELNYTPNRAVKKNVEYALSNNFGFGGTNGSLIFKKYRE